MSKDLASIEITRRQLMRTSGVLVASSLFAPKLLWAKGASASVKTASHRSLHLYNIHTGEFFKGVYWEKGRFVTEALRELNHLLRDRRTGEKTAMSNALIHLLHRVSHTLQVNKPLDIVCGYRSPKTNAKLHQQGRGVAKHSRHLTGEAVDFYVPGVKLRTVRDLIRSFQAGGVGYYPTAGFVHMDIRAKPAFWGA